MEEREAEHGEDVSRASTAPLRWFFGFDGWGVVSQEDDFVLA